MASSLISTARPSRDRGQRLLGLGADLVAQRAAGRGQHDRGADAVRSSTTMSRTMPSSTMLLRSSGSWTEDSALRTSSWVTGHPPCGGLLADCASTRGRSSPHSPPRASRDKRKHFRGSSQLVCTLLTSKPVSWRPRCCLVRLRRRGWSFTKEKGEQGCGDTGRRSPLLAVVVALGSVRRGCGVGRWDGGAAERGGRRRAARS